MAFSKLVDEFALSPSEKVMEALVKQVMHGTVSDEDIAYLANRMAESGTTLTFHNASKVADIASTGGPSFLSTLLCPLFLQAFGCVVPKLSVPGRPAGGIDVLAQIPGYRYELNASEIQDIISHFGYVHFLASKQYTPLDVALFEFRKRCGALQISPLVIASILSKKIALGVRLVGLDVRVAPHGNFGATWAAARVHATRFCRIADLVGCKAICFLSDASKPYQPFIGRGESLAALSHIFRDSQPLWLQNHLDTCYAMARRLTAKDSRSLSISRPSNADLASLFEKNLEAQGASFASFLGYVAEVEAGHVYEILSPEDGFLSVDLGALRSIITDFQSRAADDAHTRFPDPCGVILKKNSGQYVRKGELVATIRMAKTLHHDPVRTFCGAFRISPEPQAGDHFEEVENG